MVTRSLELRELLVGGEERVGRNPLVLACDEADRAVDDPTTQRCLELLTGGHATGFLREFATGCRGPRLVGVPEATHGFEVDVVGVGDDVLPPLRPEGDTDVDHCLLVLSEDELERKHGGATTSTLVHERDAVGDLGAVRLGLVEHPEGDPEAHPDVEVGRLSVWTHHVDPLLGVRLPRGVV